MYHYQALYDLNMHSYLSLKTNLPKHFLIFCWILNCRLIFFSLWSDEFTLNHFTNNRLRANLLKCNNLSKFVTILFQNNLFSVFSLVLLFSNYPNKRCYNCVAFGNSIIKWAADFHVEYFIKCQFLVVHRLLRINY